MESRLYSYKMTHDSGFAPNPFWGVLTLATCKASMRRSKRVGDWIAGFTSGALCGDRVGAERLVYLMKVAERIPTAEYYGRPRFRSKIPDVSNRFHVQVVGDNIYRPRRANAHAPRDFEQLPNPHHWDGGAHCGPRKSRDDDISGECVLTADEFAYFGGSPLSVPASVRPAVPPGQHPQGWLTRDVRRAEAFINYVFEKAKGNRVLAPPHKWPDGDDSWQEPTA
jgi:hypothetical protein